MRTNEGFIFIILNKKYMIQIECCDNLGLMSKIESGTVDLIYCDILLVFHNNILSLQK